MERAKSEERRVRRWFELEPPAPERLELQTSPRVSTVASYVFTRAAERSWELLNEHLEGPQGGVFWIGGPAGCGKTHFLDYVIALQRRAGALDAQNARRLVCGLELAGRFDGREVELFLLSVLAEQIGGDPRSGELFRQLRGASALNVGLETARRTGTQGGNGRDRLRYVALRSGGRFFRDAGTGCSVLPPGEVHRDRCRPRDGSGSDASACGGDDRCERANDY